MVVGRFGVRAVVGKGRETCDQGGVCRQSDGKHVTRAGFSTEGFAWLPLYHLQNPSNFTCVFAFFMLFPSSVIAERGGQSGGGGGGCC